MSLPPLDPSEFAVFFEAVQGCYRAGLMMAIKAG
jgi:hypothetical protein